MTAPDPHAVTAAGRPSRPGRRAVLVSGGVVAGAAAASAGWALTGQQAPAPDQDVIAPDDDLMREHGVLKRVLLCYREMTGRVQAGAPLDTQDVRDAALIIHDFIEGFHEGLEEGYVFPRLVRAGRLTSTVTTLLVQHARGRVITQFLLSQSTARGTASAGNPETRTRLAAAMQAFVRMYEPHEAREDTVVFPAFRQLVPAGELADLGQQFADLERQQFGTDEFTAMVTRVAGIEQNLGIYDLDQFTPQVTRYEPPA